MSLILLRSSVSGNRRRLWLYFGLSLAVISSLGGLLLSARALWSAHSLQVQVDRAFVLESAQQRVMSALQSHAESAVENAVAAIIDRPGWGMLYLAVLDVDGQALVARGRYEDLNRNSWMPLALRSRLRTWLYTHSGDSGRLTLRDGDRNIGKLEYAIGSTAAGLVREVAVDHLRSTAWIVGALSLLFGATILVLVRLAITAVHLLPSAVLQAGSAAAPRTTTDAPPPTTPSAEPPDLYATFDSLCMGAIAVDQELHVTRINQTAAQLTGWSAAEAIGQLVYTVFHARDDAGAPITSPAERCMREAAGQAVTEFRLRPRGGAKPDRTVEASASETGLIDGVRGALMVFQDIGVRIAGREALRAQARLAEGVIDQLSEGVFTTDMAGVVKTVNSRALRMFGYTVEEMQRLTVSRLLPVPFMNTPGIKLTDFASGGKGRMPKVAGWRKDATTFPAELVVETMRAGVEERLVVIVRDISERLRNQSLAQRLGRLLDSANEEVYIFDAQSLYFIEVNNGARKNLGLKAEQLSGMSLTTIATDISPATLQGYLSKLRGGEADNLTYKTQHRRADGSTYPVEVRLSFSREEEPPVYMAIALDITEREAAEKQMRQLAHFDALTGLPNRALLFDRLKQAMHVASRGPHQLGVFFLDLDGFKPINDNYGHEAGDQVLQAVAERLLSGLRAADTVARFGGDEFVVLALGVRNADDAVLLANKILEKFRQPFDVKGRELTVGASIGISVFPEDNSDAEGLLRHADTAMYEAKQKGTGMIQVFEKKGVANGQQQVRLNLAGEIHAGITSNQFQLQFLPVFVAGDSAAAAGLAEFQWMHPEFGRIDAAETLQVALRSGLNVELEWSLLEAVVRRSHQANEQNQPSLPVLVAITARQWCDPDFADRLGVLLDQYHTPACQLIVLINGDDWTDAAGSVQRFWPGLFKQGLRIAVRDLDLIHAATSTSALDDVSFIVLSAGYAVQVAANSETLVEVRRYAALGLPVLAEGVTAGLACNRLEVAGCTHLCGNALQMALTPTEFTQWLGDRPMRPL